MPKAILLIASAIVAVMLLFLYPTYQAYEQHDRIAFQVAHKAVTEFVDAVRSKGYITPSMYEDFMEALDTSGNLYDVQMQHDRKRYNPIYTDPADSGSFTGQFEVYYDSVFTEDIMKVLFPDNSLPKDDPSRIYRLKVMDYFSVTVKNTNTTKATLVREMLNGFVSGDTTRIFITYGGMVLNEDY